MLTQLSNLPVRNSMPCRSQWVWRFVGTALGLLACSAFGQTLTNNPLVQANFLGIDQVGTEIGNITQMTFGPDGRLYVSTYASGIKRYDYSPTGNLTNGTTVWSRPADLATGQVNGSMAVAFHQDATLGTLMYIVPAVSGGFDPTLNRTQSIVRLTDNDGDGTWGAAISGEVNQAIVNNLRVTDLHQVNQLLVDGDTLYAGVGSRTRTGGNVSEYDGAPNVDDGEFSYTGAINWIRDLTTLSANTTTPNIAGFNITQHHADTRPFTSSDEGKFTVYSTGFRNVYGLAMDGDGQLWATMNQNEDPLKPDELHRSDFHDDHKFPKINEVSGDLKLNPDALASGFFENFEAPIATLGIHASANGLDFTSRNAAFDGHAFVARFAQGDDVLSIDPDTGEVIQVAVGFSNPMDVLTDPIGNLLVGAFGSGGQVYRLNLLEGGSEIFGDLNRNGVIDSDDWVTLRTNFNADLSGLLPAEAYAFGDLNGDLLNNGMDFGLFKKAYEEANGAGAFASLFAIPEPGTCNLSMLTCAALLMSGNRVLSSPSSDSSQRKDKK
jgi:glucose/arabinose dehydrogenase